MRYGRKIQGNLVDVPPQSLRTSQPGEVYEFHIFTEDPYDDDKVPISQLMLLEQQYPDLQIEYVETFPANKSVVLQVKDIGPGGFTASGIASLIPTLFVVIGIVVAGILIWQVITTASPLLIWLAALAGVGILFYYFIGRTLPPPSQVRKEGTSSARIVDRTSRKLQSLNRRRVSAQNQREDMAKKKAELISEMDKIEGRIDKLQKNKPRGYTKRVKQLTQEREKLAEIKGEAEEKFWKADEEHNKIISQITEMEAAFS